MGVALLSLSVHAPALAQAQAQAQARPYLDWPGKRAPQESTPPAAPETAPATPLQHALPNAATGQPGFDIPPSPYGQVGNPYRHELNWRGKTAPVTAQAAAPQTAPQTAPKTELASNWTPVPQTRFDAPRRAAPAPVAPPAQPAPQKVEAAPLPTPRTPETIPARVANPLPLPQPKPPVVSAETIARETAPVATVKPAPTPPVPTPPVQAQAEPKPQLPVQVQPQAQPQPRPDSGYRLPANSKYAGRVSPELEGRPALPAQAAAPVAQKPDAPAQTAPQTTAEAKPAATAQTPAAKTPAAKASAPKAGAKTTDTKTAEAKPADVKTATAPAATAPLAQAAEQESAEPYTPFVPGSRATTASQAPRFYSLHRAYGYEPDPAPHTGGDLALDPGAVQTPAPDKASEGTSSAQKTNTPPAKDKTL
ncbi:arylesterase-related protein [Asticcacaulis excentricus]|uniref:Arylesterase-related protein n=1 Tax=Asticcacaulis excentricus TaxID=78587 RepID=A0A3G9G922_9CAUL|nr:arylesterase-related protein [Asticcacaulis excentricus]